MSAKQRQAKSRAMARARYDRAQNIARINRAEHFRELTDADRRVVPHAMATVLYPTPTELAPLHRHATMASPVLNPHASKFSQNNTRTYRLGFRLNCTQESNTGDGANQPVKVWRRTNAGALTFEIDC